jgi:hypothetical protein
MGYDAGIQPWEDRWCSPASQPAESQERKRSCMIWISISLGAVVAAVKVIEMSTTF